MEVMKHMKDMKQTIRIEDKALVSDRQQDRQTATRPDIIADLGQPSTTADTIIIAVLARRKCRTHVPTHVIEGLVGGHSKVSHLIPFPSSVPHIAQYHRPAKYYTSQAQYRTLHSRVVGA
eukprot:1874318-Rhodomonas_salina.2